MALCGQKHMCQWKCTGLPVMSYLSMNVVGSHTSESLCRPCFDCRSCDLPQYRVIGGIGPPGWGSNAQKGLIRREFWGLGSILAKTGSGCSLGMFLQLWMTARAYPPDEKIGLPPNAAVLSLFQMFLVRKTLQRTPSTG